MIRAEIVADSLSPQGDRLTSLLITFPRIILAEVNTHRMLSKNTASSRAIPFNKMVEAVKENPFIPIAWQKEHKGMQGSDYITDQEEIQFRIEQWLKARDLAVDKAEDLDALHVTKQLCNRLLEPFMWTTMLITGSKEGWDNFFELRCPQYQMSSLSSICKSKKEAFKAWSLDRNPDNMKWLKINKGQAEIHIITLAEAIYDAMNESTPKQLKSGEWHIPFEDIITESSVDSYLKKVMDMREDGLWGDELIQEARIKISTAMAARTSYTLVGEEKEIDYQKMIALHDKLIAQKPLHASPMEHCARAMSDDEYEINVKGQLIKNLQDSVPEYNEHVMGWCRNYKGFIQYRHILENDLS